MPVPPAILDLIQRFERSHAAYRGGQYNETQLRREFLDPFFEELGWDMTNRQGCAEAYKDVVHEDAIKVGGATKAPDYAFRIGGRRKFFVEAKKPSVNVKDDISPAFQLRRYAWSAGLPLSILSDFEEFAVYDCRGKPDQRDKASTGRILYCTYRDYATRWDEIAAVFHRDAVLQGAFDQYAESRGKHGSAEVDHAFLAEIERWRDLLARNIALRNPALSQRELNYAVQITIDRIIFLRICEDRGIEFYGQLQALLNGGGVYQRMAQLFQQADARYNSGLFHFKPEKGRGGLPDALTPALHIDDKPLKDILRGLYYPDSPYEFSVLPAEILGQVYEQFLGKVIRLTAGHHAVVEDKPEVKKAGGVFYTPAYIVEYIVRQTLGKALERYNVTTFKRLNVPTLTVLDPACGSGSFLLGAYQYLLDWHRDAYAAAPEKWAKGKDARLYQAAGGEWKLTTAERKRILLEHIYGVDIDPQAVEVTKLSLLLKVLEGESEQTLNRQLSLFKERALPDLAANIQCGNSLIGPDFYAGQLTFLNAEERYRVNAFDWQAAFPQVFAAGGFDVVIGNPPYIRIQTMGAKDIAYLSKNYETTVGNYDIYCPFLEKALKLLNKKGLSGYILPHRFFKTDYGDGLRALLSKNQYIYEIVDFDGFMVFSKASINTCILILSKEGRDNFKFSQVRFINRSESEMPGLMNQIQEEIEGSNFVSGLLPASSLGTTPWVFIFPRERSLWDRMNSFGQNLRDSAQQIFQGLKTGGDAFYSVRRIRQADNFSEVLSSLDNQTYKVENALLYPQIKGGEMKRYNIRETDRVVIFPYTKGVLINPEEIRKSYPLAWQYFKSHQKFLENRESGKMQGKSWYGYTRSQALSSMQQSKILTPDYYAHASYCLDKTGDYFFFGGGAGGYGIVLKREFDPLYVMGLLNSKLIDWFMSKISVRQYQTAFSYVKKYIEQVPIRPIDFTNPADAARHARTVALVEAMLALHQQLAAAKTPNEKTMLQRQVEAADRQIDALVYELYGLTEEEIKIVEG